MVSISTDGFISFGQASALLGSLWLWAGSVTTIRIESSTPGFRALNTWWKAYWNLSWLCFAPCVVLHTTLTHFCFSSCLFILELPEHFPLVLSVCSICFSYLPCFFLAAGVAFSLFTAGEKAAFSTSLRHLLYHFLSACSCPLKTFYPLQVFFLCL